MLSTPPQKRRIIKIHIYVFSLRAYVLQGEWRGERGRRLDDQAEPELHHVGSFRTELVFLEMLAG